jgi:hypothetical protein
MGDQVSHPNKTSKIIVSVSLIFKLLKEDRKTKDSELNRMVVSIP